MGGVWVFLGGGGGAWARWMLGLWLPNPWATLAVNVIGSFALAALMHPALRPAPEWQLALGTGLLGGFTTYSTFNLLLLAAIREGDLRAAALQAGLTLFGCLGAGWLGWAWAGRAAAG